jgi:hypothetical protein
MKTLVSALFYLAANAIGLLVAKFAIPGFQIDWLSFIVVVIVFSAILAVIGPLIEDTARKQAPAVMGGIALLTVGAGLFLTSLLMRGLVIGGFVNWIAATLLVWIGSVAASLILPKVVARFKKV